MARSTPEEGSGCGGVYSGVEKMKLRACNVMRTRTQNWMIVGSGRYFFGIGGNPIDSEEREMKTNVWSDGSAAMLLPTHKSSSRRDSSRAAP